MIRRTLVLVALSALSVLVFAGCGDDGQDTQSVDRTPTSAAPAGSEGSDAGSSAELSGLAEIEQRGKPPVTVPDAPATELGITDDIEGTGPAVAPGDTVTVHYVGVGQQSGKEFDASWGGQTATFSLDGVIQGWTEGLVGMKAGGRRTLVIPGELAYGANPPSADIQPDETLVFTIDLVAIA